MRSRLFFPLLLASSLAWAQGASKPAGLEPIPDGPPDVSREQNVPAPEVTIRQRGGQGMIEEYRIHGALYMIKIIPAKGAPYYLVDATGDGALVRYNDVPGGMLIPAWVLLRW